MQKYLSTIILFFISLTLFAQIEPDDYYKKLNESDSLIKYANETEKAKNYSFTINCLNKNGRKYTANYFCRVLNDQILKMECSYTPFEKNRSDGAADGKEIIYYDSTTYYETYYFHKGKWVSCSQRDEPVYYEFVKGDSASGKRNTGTPWSVNVFFYQGKYFTESSNGHGATESDEWNPALYFQKLYADRLKEVHKKFPTWK